MLARAAHAVLPTGAGAERAVAATKTYTSQLAVLAAFWSAWVDDGALSRALATEVPPAMEAALAIEGEVRSVAARLSHAERLIVAGRGFNCATALETALKIEETCYLAAMPYSAADLPHGPIAMVEPQYPVLLVAPGGATRAGMLELQKELRRRGAETYVIADEADEAGGATAVLPLTRSVPEALSPLMAVIPGQLLALTSRWRAGSTPTARAASARSRVRTEGGAAEAPPPSVARHVRRRRSGAARRRLLAPTAAAR